MITAKFNCARGTQTNWGGCTDPYAAGIEEGAAYEVERIERHTWHTKITLKGIKGKFNSVCFDVRGDVV